MAITESQAFICQALKAWKVGTTSRVPTPVNFDGVAVCIIQINNNNVLTLSGSFAKRDKLSRDLYRQDSFGRRDR
jgi:hypothetical protein